MNLTRIQPDKACIAALQSRQYNNLAGTVRMSNWLGLIDNSQTCTKSMPSPALLYYSCLDCKLDKQSYRCPQNNSQSNNWYTARCRLNWQQSRDYIEYIRYLQYRRLSDRQGNPGMMSDQARSETFQPNKERSRPDQLEVGNARKDKKYIQWLQYR